MNVPAMPTIRALRSPRLWLTLLVLGAMLIGLRPHPSAANGEDLIIVSLGDSIGAGEGAPDIFKQNGGPTWIDAGSPPLSSATVCHRSARSGSARAFAQIKQARPTAFFIHAACSGAEINNGVLTTQLNDNGSVKVGTSQVTLVKDWMAANKPNGRISAVFLNVGANDIGFVKIVGRCMSINPLESPCHEDAGLAAEFNTRLANLGPKYVQLASVLQAELNPVKVFISQYHDPVWKTTSAVCNYETANGDAMRLISGAEAQWASNVVVASLNQKIADAVTANAGRGWNLVTPVSFRGHSYCSADRWVNTYKDSQDGQGDETGTVHPNPIGYLKYGDAFASAFNAQWPVLSPVNIFKANPTANSVQIAWFDHSDTETRYEVQVTAVATNTQTLVSLSPDTRMWTHGSLPASTTHNYLVRACNTGGCTPWSNQVTYTTPVPPTPTPSAPTNLKDNVTFSPNGEIAYHKLTWTQTSTNQTYQHVWHREVGAPVWSAEPMPTATTAVWDLGPASTLPRATFRQGHSYEFYVRVCNSHGCAQSAVLRVNM